MKETFNAATGYLGKSCVIQTKEQFRQIFLDLVLKIKLHEAVIFVCAQETGGGGGANKLIDIELDGRY